VRMVVVLNMLNFWASSNWQSFNNLPWQ
jgi:hypothetical protein